MREERVRDLFAEALGEPRQAAAAAQRLEAFLRLAPALEAERQAERRHPRGAAALAAALAALVLVGLLAVRAGGDRLAKPATAGRPPAATTPVPAGSPPAPGCVPNAPARLIVVDLTAQRLTAYDSGCPFLETPVTTGGPELPTPPGTYHLLVKSATWRVVSPYPISSPHWFPDTTVHDYLRLSAGGLAIHSAEWEPADRYGPGSERGAYATHGDVHVQVAPLQRLYDWAAIGTTVVVRS